MPTLAANLSMLFTELAFPARFDAAAAAGFRHVEYQFPYDWPASDVARWAREAGVETVLHNLPPGDLARGDRGLVAQPGRVDEFRAGVERSIEYASVAACPRLNCLAGVVPAGTPRETWWATMVENVAWAAARLKSAGIRMMIEACNTRSVPGYLLPTSRSVLEVIDAAGADNAWLQYDLFHMQIMEGDLARSIETLLSRIGHMQLADVPDRHEPGTGEINYPWLLARIDALGYEGVIGCEYNPGSGTAAGLGWAAPYLRPRSTLATAATD